MKRVLAILIFLLPVNVWAECEGFASWDLSATGSNVDEQFEATCEGLMGDVSYSITPSVIITDATSPDESEMHLRIVDAVAQIPINNDTTFAMGIMRNDPAVQMDSVCLDTAYCAADLHQPFDALDGEKRIGTPMVQITHSGLFGIATLYAASHADILTVGDAHLNALPDDIVIRDSITYQDRLGLGVQTVLHAGNTTASASVYDGPARTPTHINMDDNGVQMVASGETAVTLAMSTVVDSSTLRATLSHHDRDDERDASTVVVEHEHIMQVADGHDFQEIGVAYTGSACDARFDADCVYQGGYILGKYERSRGKTTLGVTGVVAVDFSAAYIEPSARYQWTDNAEFSAGLQLADGDDDTFVGFNKDSARAYIGIDIFF